MSSIAHQAWFGDNIGSPSTAVNFGPFTTSAAVSRLLRARATASFAFPGVDLAPTAILDNIVAWGVQAYITGYTPLDLPADLGGYTFLWSELAASNAVAGAAWTPPANDLGWIGSTVAYRQWRGQIPIGNPVDLYLSVGATIAGAPAFITTWSMEVDYTY